MLQMCISSLSREKRRMRAPRAVDGDELYQEFRDGIGKEEEEEEEEEEEKVSVWLSVFYYIYRIFRRAIVSPCFCNVSLSLELKYSARIDFGFCEMCLCWRKRSKEIINNKKAMSKLPF